MPDRDASVSGGVRVEIDAGVAVVTIDRPEVRNAIGFATVDELDAALDVVWQSDAAVPVLRGGAARPEGLPEPRAPRDRDGRALRRKRRASA